MKIEKTELNGVLLITLEPFRDFRGRFVELWSMVKFDYCIVAAHVALGIPNSLVFVEDDINVSKKGVLKGFHSDSLAWKLLTCLHGVMQLVIADCDESKPTFGKWQVFNLNYSSVEVSQLLVPPKHGIAFLTLSEEAILHYKQTQYYNPARQSTYRYDDPRFGIDWSIVAPILSERDECRGKDH